MKIFDFKSLQDWQKKKIIWIWGSVVLIGLVFLATASCLMVNDRKGEEYYWEADLLSDPAVDEHIKQYNQDAAQVTVGTYVENLKEIALKTNSFRVEMLAWFRWEGRDDLDMAHHFRVYKGTINKMELVKDYHEDGVNYQLVRCDVSVSKNFWTRRFPLESHQLRVYIESEYPVDDVMFVPDKENSGINRNISISGYELRKYDTAVINMQYDGTNGDPELKEALYTSEFLTAMEVNRNSWGLYVKCFIALVGTTTWVLITLFINTYHRVDPLGMLPAALFGTVTNVMVGANLLPDALQMGLLEYVNFWGIFTILAVAVSVININRIRNKYEDKEFAQSFGRLMFYTVLCLVAAGHVLLPVSAYMFS